MCTVLYSSLEEKKDLENVLVRRISRFEIVEGGVLPII